MSPWVPSARRFQNRLLHVVGGGDREPTIQQMLTRDARDTVSYWLQLAVSVGIATLGLVLGSTAVVIAAMLVAPLMGPIVGLGMGLATGGPLLTLRAALRTASSVAVVVAGSALVTTMLPFHEMNAEIAARTVPTALDLITAAFCALAGVYAAVRTTSDTATTAAGTSIGISLVPPLCAAGFCIGTSQWALALGALLLFLTNMVAIVLVGMLSFIAFGFNQVKIADLEADHLGHDGHERAVRGVARALAGVFASRWGSWLRVLMPIALLAAVYVPLRRALDEVTWQVKVRAATRGMLEDLDEEIVTSRIHVERHQVEVTLVVIGTHAAASRIQDRIETEIGVVSGVSPRVDVRAVPDAAAAAAVEPLLPLVQKPAPPLPDPFATRLDELHDELIDAISSRWPARTTGDALAVSIEATAADLVVNVAHIGEPLDGAAREILERALADELDVSVTLTDDALPATPRVLDESPATIALVARLVERGRRLENVFVCLHEPAPEPELVPSPTPIVVVSPPKQDPFRALLADHPRVGYVADDRLAISFAVDGCPGAEVEPPTP